MRWNKLALGVMCASVAQVGLAAPEYVNGLALDGARWISVAVPMPTMVVSAISRTYTMMQSASTGGACLTAVLAAVCWTMRHACSVSRWIST